MNIIAGLRRRNLLAGSALLLVIFSTAPLAADSSVYSTKFACGTVTGTLPTVTDPTPPPAQTIYRDVEPGSYATVLNILHAPYTPPNTVQLASVHISIVVDGLGETSLNRGFLPFTTRKIGCPEITQQLALAFPSFTADGRFVEGYLHVRVSNPSWLEVSAIYTYAVRNAAAGVGSSMQVVNLTGHTVPFDPIE